MSMEAQGQYSKLYIGPSGSTPTKPSVEVDLIVNASLDDGNEEVDNTTRRNGGRKSTDVGQSDWSLNFQVLYKAGDTASEMLRSAKFAGTTLAMMALTDDSTTGEGIIGEFVIPQRNRTEDQNSRVAYDFVARLFSDGDEVTDGPT